MAHPALPGERTELMVIEHRADVQVASQVVTGPAAADRIRELAGFIDARSTAFCTDSAWLGAAARNLRGEPVVVTVTEGGTEVTGLAALTRTRQRGVWGIALLGAEFNDYGQFYYATDRAAGALADAVAGWVEGEHRAWSLALGQLPTPDRVVDRLTALLPGARLRPGEPIPQIRGVGTDYRVSRNRRRKANNAVNRIEADGRSWEQVAVRDRCELDRWLPVVIEVRRERDHACGRRSHLDDPGARAFYEEFVRGLCDRGDLIVDLLLVDGAVAGYGMVVVERGVHRVFDGRVAEGLQHYRGAMMCDLAAVTRAMEDPSVTTFDWLRGRTDGKFGNHEEVRTDLVATAHPIIGRLERWDGAARRHAKALLPESALRRLARR